MVSGPGRFGQPIMKLVNERFGELPQLRPDFAGELPQSPISRKNFECT
jgi:hypothetical protein